MTETPSRPHRTFSCRREVSNANATQSFFLETNVSPSWHSPLFRERFSPFRAPRITWRILKGMVFPLSTGIHRAGLACHNRVWQECRLERGYEEPLHAASPHVDLTATSLSISVILRLYIYTYFLCLNFCCYYCFGHVACGIIVSDQD